MNTYNNNDNINNNVSVAPPEERAPNQETIKKENNYINIHDDPRCVSQPLTTGSISSSSDLLQRPPNVKNNNNKTKLVRFASNTTFHHLNTIQNASEMSIKEKSKIWYTSNEYDQFKYQAAKQAGVKIVRYDTHSISASSHHFVMCGDFDSKKVDLKDNVSNGTPSEGGKLYYNENEYNDHTHKNSRKEVVMTICKRGLGYHFSRSRKKSRIVTRSAVVAWQKTLMAQSNQTNLKLPTAAGSSNTSISVSGKHEKASMMLALVSEKCSRVAQEEAKWRGDVDYRVAYPERHVDSKVVSNKANSNAGAINKKKRSSCDSSSSSSHIHTDARNAMSRSHHSKRQRRNAAVGASCCVDTSSIAICDGALSPTTIGYLVSGVRHAEV
jgi:hypothetical protein